MDDWDPAFIDQLAGKGYRVIIFDYVGIGLSYGELPTEITKVAGAVKELADALHIDKFIIGGWSFGGLVAQTFSAHYPQRIIHTILIGTKPPGKNDFTTEQIFLDTAFHEYNDLADEVILFFEPASEQSKRAAQLSHDRIAARTLDKDLPVPSLIWPRYFQAAEDFTVDSFNARQKLGEMSTPILVLSGDHDPVCPIENWYALTRVWSNLYIIMFPQAGHGPQHQLPLLSAEYIHSFILHNQD